MRLVLASRSPRRQGLLDQMGLDFDIDPIEVDESRYPEEEPEKYVERMGRAKAERAAADGRLVIAGDTAVVSEGRVIGKPSHPEEARSMLRRLQGRSHEVVTAMAVAAWDRTSHVLSLVDVAAVELSPMTDGEIAEYVETGEPLDKAGAYALQGLGGRFVRAVSGHPSTVIGLPIHLLPRLIAAHGHDLSSFRRLT
jgi:septum formation protein